MIEKFAIWLVDQQAKKPWRFILTFLLIIVLLVPGIFRLVNNVEPSLERVLPQEVQEIKSMNQMRSEFGADMMYLVVYIESPIEDVRHPQLLKYIDSLTQKLQTRNHILEVHSLAEISKNDQGVIPGSYVEVKELLKKNPETLKFTNRDYSITVIQIRSDTGSSAELIREVVNNIKTDIASVEVLNPGARIEITGFNAIDKATFEVIISDFAVITALSMALVMLVVIFTFRSIGKSIMPMIVVMIALVSTMGIAGYLHFTITVVSMVAAAMIMGLGIDFGIHIVHNYYLLKKTHLPVQAMKETMRELLRAMLAASFTTMAGFLALLFGVLPAMKTLGMILAIGIFSTLIGAVFLLPPILFVYDQEDISMKLNKNYKQKVKP